MTLELRNDYFFMDEKPFWPIGFNHWPSSTGVHCWNQFNAEEWREDFLLMQARGYNTMRMFLLWEVFQPEEDRIDESMIAKLQQVCAIAQEIGVWLVPTIFQGWMSGTNFDPPWRRGRNHICDESLRPAMVRLCKAVAEALVPYSNILAIDLANEINVICPDVNFAAIASWTQQLGDAIREARPGTLVFNGDAVPSAQARSKWSFEPQKVDVQSMHGYPVFWTPLPLGRLGNIRTSLVFGYMTAFAHAYGPVMREEFGTAIGGDSGLIGQFIRANCASSYLSGANGFLYWCWRDFASEELPYRHNPSEGTLGYLTAEGAVKDWSAGYDQFMHFLKEYGDYRPAPSDAGIYLTRNFKKLGDHGDVAMATAYELMALNGVTPKVMAKLTDDVRLIVLPLAVFEIDEIKALQSFVENGGCVIACEPNFKMTSHYWEALTGFRTIDMLRYSGKRRMRWDEEEILCDPMLSNTPAAVFESRREDARVLVSEGDLPLVTSSKLGKGTIVQFILPIGDSDEREVCPSRLRIWRRLMEASGYVAPISITPAGCCQAGIIQNSTGEQKILAINHSNKPVTVQIQGLGREWNGTIEQKGFVVL